MSKTLHTAGPWKASFTRISEVHAPNGMIVAKCQRNGSLVELQANAHLIALAPECFELVRQLSLIAEGLKNGNSSAEMTAIEIAQKAQSIARRLS